MDNVFDISEDFDFSQINLDNPVPLNGGSYYTNISISKGTRNLYIQLPKVSTKNGIIKNSNKVYCDLMFNSSSKEILNWLETFEKTCQNLIYNKRELWFHNKITRDDIEDIMNPIIRSFRSGKYFLLRVYLKGGKCNVFDETEKVFNLEDLNLDHEFIPLINLDGLRFNNKNIQLEIILTQIMVLIPVKDFEKKCLIKINKEQTISQKPIDTNLDNLISKSDLLNETNSKSNSNVSSLIHSHSDNYNNNDSIDDKDSDENNETNHDNDINNNNKLNYNKNTSNNKKINQYENINDNYDNIDNNENNDKNEKNNNKSLEEVDICINEENNDNLTLKDPQEVFKDIYQVARKKAYDLRKNALEAYLEAQSIKNEYSLDGLDDSENEEEFENLFRNNV